jgi:hypothetical protein
MYRDTRVTFQMRPRRRVRRIDNPIVRSPMASPPRMATISELFPKLDLSGPRLHKKLVVPLPWRPSSAVSFRCSLHYEAIEHTSHCAAHACVRRLYRRCPCHDSPPGAKLPQSSLSSCSAGRFNDHCVYGPERDLRAAD